MIINPYRYVSGGGGAFPTYIESVPTVNATSGTSHSADMPATVNAGDLLLLLLANNNGAASLPTISGWTSFYNDSQAPRLRMYYKVAAGTEGGTTLSITTAGSVMTVALVVRIAAGTYQTAPQVTANKISVSTTSFNPPNLAPSWGSADTLWMAIMVTYGNPIISVYPLPSGQTRTIAANLNGICLGTCYDTISAASLDPSAFTIGQLEMGLALTLAVRPA